MPKRLSDFTFADYLHLRPLTQALKTRRYRRIDQRYYALASPHGDVAGLRAQITGRNVLCTVAFDDPQGLAMHAALVRRYVDHEIHLIIDNSTSADATATNRALAAEGGLAYLRLPDNPWTARNDSRSHGLALNWTWRNVLRPAAPSAFGFVDDDMFPLADCAPFAPLAEHGYCGDIREAGERWFLWAGFCFFRFNAVRDLPLDFGLDWFVGLDTGGANWSVLYAHADRSRLPQRPILSQPALAGVPEDLARFERRGEWLHEVGWGTDPRYRAAKREALIALLGPHLADAPGHGPARDNGGAPA